MLEISCGRRRRERHSSMLRCSKRTYGLEELALKPHDLHFEVVLQLKQRGQVSTVLALFPFE